MTIYEAQNDQTNESVRIIYKATGMIPITYYNVTRAENQKRAIIKSCFEIFPEVNNIVCVRMSDDEFPDVAVYDIDSAETKDYDELCFKVTDKYSREDFIK